MKHSIYFNYKSLLISLFSIFFFFFSCQSKKKSDQPSASCSTKSRLLEQYPSQCIPIFLENSEKSVIEGFLFNQKLGQQIREKDLQRDTKQSTNEFLSRYESEEYVVTRIDSLHVMDIDQKIAQRMQTRSLSNIKVEVSHSKIYLDQIPKDDLYDLFFYTFFDNQMETYKTEVVLRAGQMYRISLPLQIQESFYFFYFMNHSGNEGVGKKVQAETIISTGKQQQNIKLMLAPSNL